MKNGHGVLHRDRLNFAVKSYAEGLGEVNGTEKARGYAASESIVKRDRCNSILVHSCHLLSLRICEARG